PVKQVSQPTFNFITVRYDRSFEARVIQLDDVNKDFYSQLKNELLSYPKVKSRMSWRHEAFRLGRQTVAKMRCRGRRLCVYLALDPKQYAETKYLVEDVSEVKTSAATPCLYRIKNERRCRYAKQLIAAMFAAMGIEKGEEKNDNYVVPYEPLEPLLARGLVKRIEVKSNVLGEAAPAMVEEDDDDIVEIIRVPDEEPEEVIEEVVEEPVEEPVEEVVEETVEEPVEEVVEEPVPEPAPEPEEEHVSVSVVEAQEAMEDETAAKYVAVSSEVSDKSKQVVVNVDTLSKYFRSGDRVTIKEMKEVIPFVPNKATYVKVLARGRIDKSLEVVADDFSLDAVKMIVLAGGSVIRKRNN
nr:uL15 family ribosomal protein [Clostridiales bacterium]